MRQQTKDDVKLIAIHNANELLEKVRKEFPLHTQHLMLELFDVLTDGYEARLTDEAATYYREHNYTIFSADEGMD